MEVEHDALWRTVIKEFYGETGGFDISPNSFGSGGVWCDILKVVKNVQELCGDGTQLKDLFPKLYALDSFKDFDGIDKWAWSMDVSGRFKVKSLVKLTTRSNLSSRGVNVTSSLCPFVKMWRKMSSTVLLDVLLWSRFGGKFRVGGI
ncbi:hypothetical protein Tco_1229110 [Tanacetum coccineum]